MITAMEIFYNGIEAITLTLFIVTYFQRKPAFSKLAGFVFPFFTLIFTNTLTTILSPNLALTMLIAVAVITAVSEIMCEGILAEHIFIAVTSFLLLLLTDTMVFTSMSHILGTKYAALVNGDGVFRFMTIIAVKMLYIMIVFAAASLKKKRPLLLRRSESVTSLVSLVVSIIMMILIRNIIYMSPHNYKIFLIIALCLLFLNLAQYFTMVYISNKNMTENQLILMKMQLEMQEENVHHLEEKYEETAIIRHDIKNHLACLLEIAERENYNDITEYLHGLSESSIYKTTNYVSLNRKVLCAVINAKAAAAEQKGFGISCTVLNEMDTIKDADIGILLANLLDNAIEACEKNKGRSEIVLKMWSEAGYYCLEINNTVETDIIMKNSTLATSKQDKKIHGLGLKSVRNIVEKYNGMMNWTQKFNKFRVLITLER